MDLSPPALRGRLRLHATPVAVFLTAALCALAAAEYVRRAVDAQADIRFAAEVEGSVDAIRNRMDAYTAMLRAARALHEATGAEPDPKTFARFVAGLDIGRRYPGIRGIGWAKVLRPEEVPAHEAAMRRIFPEF